MKADLDENLKIIRKILLENEKLYKIYDILKEIETLESCELDFDPQCYNPEIYQEIQYLHEENIRVNRIKIQRESKYDRKIKEKHQLKE